MILFFPTIASHPDLVPALMPVSPPRLTGAWRTPPEASFPLLWRMAKSVAFGPFSSWRIRSGVPFDALPRSIDPQFPGVVFPSNSISSFTPSDPRPGVVPGSPTDHRSEIFDGSGAWYPAAVVGRDGRPATALK